MQDYKGSILENIMENRNSSQIANIFNIKIMNKNGGTDETRTRDLSRDRRTL
jgi:hypothetical protein